MLEMLIDDPEKAADSFRTKLGIKMSFVIPVDYSNIFWLKFLEIRRQSGG